MVKIFIDPGHGGTDPGAQGNGLQEKNLTMQISNRIRDMLLEYENTQVKLSREGDQTLSLKQRTDMANAWGADFVLSVHINASGGTGYEDYRHNSTSADSLTGKIQNNIHSEVMAGIKDYGVRDRGAKAANFHMLRESNMQSLLTENLFLDNVSDAKLLKQSSFIDAIARGHVNGLVKVFGLKALVTSSVEEVGLMSQPFNPTSSAIKNSVAVVLNLFEQKDPGLSKMWREQFLKGELTISDVVGLLYVAVDRGYIQGIPKE
jgi:N-acetylmuramoyl-L-alanine amidase